MAGVIAGMGAGAVGGVFADQLTKKIHQWFEEEEEWEKLLHHFPEEWAQLCKDMHSLALAQGAGAIRQPMTLWPTGGTGMEGVPINRQGRSNASLFTIAAVKIQIFVLGVGMYQPTTVIGWNSLGCPDGSTLALPSSAAGSMNVLVVYDDVNRGVAI